MAPETTLALKLAPSALARGYALLEDVRAHRRTFGNVKQFCEAQKGDADKADRPAKSLYWNLVLRYIDGIWTRESRESKHFTPAPLAAGALPFASARRRALARQKPVNDPT
jgi:hypothetical protein